MNSVVIVLQSITVLQRTRPCVYGSHLLHVLGILPEYLVLVELC